jgi:hypothetical protein
VVPIPWSILVSSPLAFFLFIFTIHKFPKHSHYLFHQLHKNIIPQL